MASSSRTDSWPRGGRISASEGNQSSNHHSTGGVDQNQNKRNNHQHTKNQNNVDKKQSDSDALRAELAKLRKDWTRLQQENMVGFISFSTTFFVCS